jgi:hypothetical protein
MLLLWLLATLPILCMVLGVILAVWLVDGQMRPLAVIGMGLGFGMIPPLLLWLTEITRRDDAA